MRVCGTCREIEISQFCQPRMFMAGNRHHPTVMQAELAGKAQDLFGFTGDGKHNRQRVASHIIGDREIRIVNMVAEFPDVGKEARAIFRQRAGSTGADENNTLGGENNIDGLFEQLIELVIIDAFKKLIISLAPIFAC